jgi:hypothetical protein
MVQVGVLDMTLRFMEGFDWLDPTGAVYSLLAADGGAIVNSMNAIGGRFGLGLALQMHETGASFLQHWLRVLDSKIEGEFILGAAILTPPTAPNLFWIYCYDDATGTNPFGILVDSTGKWRVYSGGTLIGSSRPGLWFLNTWHYIQLKAKAGSDGFMTLKVDGEIVIDVHTNITIAGTGFDCLLLQNTGNSAPPGERWGIDDIYIVDTDGDAPWNDWLGNIRVGVMKPNAAGDSTDFTPEGAPSNWQAVTADYRMDPDDPTYVWTQTVGDYDLYNMETNVPAREIFGIESKIFYRQTDAIQLFSQNVMKTGGVEYFGDVRGVAQTYVGRNTYYQANPGTLDPWTNVELADIQIGPKLNSSD